MCVEGLRAIPLGCSDCYDKDNIQNRKPMLGGLGGAGSGGWAGVEQGQGQGQGLASSPCGTLHSTSLRNGSFPQNNCSLNT